MGFAVLAWLVALTPPLERLELATIDARATIPSDDAATRKIVTIGIGDRTLQEWPEPTLFWGSRYADILKAVTRAGGRVVAFDIVQSVNPDEYVAAPGPTSNWTREIATAEGRVVLACILARDGTVTYPLDALLLASEMNVGHINLEVSPDGVYRLVPGALSGQDGSEIEPFSLMAARATKKEGNAHLKQLATEGLAYLRRPGKIPLIEGSDVVAGRADSELRGTTAVVGWTFTGNSDLLLQPGGSYLAGAQLQADAIAAYLHNDYLQRFPRWAEVGLSFLLAIGVMFQTNFRSSLSGIALPLGLAVAVLVVAPILAAKGFLLPVVAPLVAILGTTLLCQTGLLVDDRLRGIRADLAFGGSASPALKAHLLEEGGRLRARPDVVEGVVMFVDIRSSVSFGEGRAPDELLAEINQFLALGVFAVESAGGIMVRFLGDGFLSIFGYPSSDEADKRAWTASANLIDQSRKWNAHREEPLKFGIGLNRGKFAVGYAGDSTRQEFTVLGDTVNVAARLERFTKTDKYSGDVVASDSVSAPAHGFERFGPFDDIVSGRSTPVRFWSYRRTEGDKVTEC